MNKIFRVKWNAAQNRYDVTSELTKGKTKSRSGDNSGINKASHCRALLSVCAILFSPITPAMAADILLDTFKPGDGGHTQIIAGKDNLTATNGWASIAMGKTGSQYKTMAEAFADGEISGTGTDYLDKGRIVLDKKVGYNYYDEDTGTTQTFQAYDNTKIKEVSFNQNLVPINMQWERMGNMLIEI